MVNVLSRFGLTRDSRILLVGLFVSVVNYLAGSLGLLNQAMGPVIGARVTLTSGVISIVFAYLRISPLRLSPGSELAGTKDPTQTLTITGKVPIVLLAIALAGGAMSGCAWLTNHGGAAHVAVAADTVLTDALHLALQTERTAYAQGAFSKDQHTKNLKVIKKADEDAIALTDAIAGARKIGANTQDAAVLLVTTKGAVSQLLIDLSSLPADAPLVKALRAVLAALN